MSTDIFNKLLNVGDLFNYIFSFIDFIDKLSFRCTSVQCKKWIDQRLQNNFICDDLDEFLFFKKDNQMHKFITPDDKYLSNFINDKNYNNFQNVMKILINKRSIIYLKHICNEYERKNTFDVNRCDINYFCYYWMHNLNVRCKDLINKHLIIKSYCTNKLNCESCSNIIYLCVENDWTIPSIFFNDLSDDKIFELMIVAGCHGSYNIFVCIYNYFKNLNKCVVESTMCTILILILRYHNMSTDTKYSKLYYQSKKINENTERFNKHSSINIAHLGYDKIIQGFWPSPTVDESIINIFNNIDQKFIDKILSKIIKMGLIDDILFYGTYIKTTSDHNIKLLLEIKAKNIGEKIFGISELIKKFIINKYGNIDLSLFLDIIYRDENKLHDPNPDIFLNNLSLFKKYYDSLY